MENISYHNGSTLAKSAFLNAVIHFPMNSYCEELCSHNHMTCTDYLFLPYFFKLLSQLVRNFLSRLDCQTKSSICQAKEYIMPSESLHRHGYDFCNYALIELKGKYINHWQMNFIFTTSYLNTSPRCQPRKFNSFSSVIQALTASSCNAAIIDKFQLLLKKSDEALIISKAAMYCLQYLCSSSRTAKMAKWHLGIREMDRNHRKTRPWQWHRQASCRDLSKKPVLTVFTDFMSEDKLTLTTYGRLPRRKNHFYYYIYSLHLQQWFDWESYLYNSFYSQSWRKYLSLLEYLPTILPHAGKFLPLIHLCKTKAFAPISMMFPDLSRRARHAICEYLNRVEADSWLR